MTAVRSLCALILLLLPGAASAAALAAEKPADKSEKKDDKKPASLSKAYEGMEFRNIGPFRGGRVCAVAGVRGAPLVYYFGGTGGGVWKTVDGGSNWQAVSDKDFKTGSVGALAVSESDPNVIYAGMGEAAIRGNVSHGDGVDPAAAEGTDVAELQALVELRDRALAGLFGGSVLLRGGGGAGKE